MPSVVELPVFVRDVACGLRHSAAIGLEVLVF